MTDINWGLTVGQESRKTWLAKHRSGFWERYCSGLGIDIGYAGYLDGVTPILPHAIGVDLDYDGYDGVTLPFQSKTLDFVYSSHVLEHIDNRYSAIAEWYRVLKRGGNIVIVVPHRDLYEKRRRLPSKWNPDHKVFYTPASLLREVESVLPVNSCRVRHMQDNDRGHDYTQSNEEHSLGEYEIELVLEKLR
jgi:SAM-dependent methyltransferase